MRKVAIGLMAKHAEIGQVKTRLAKDIGERKALAVYELLLGNAVLSVCDLNLFLRVAFVTPSHMCDPFSKRYDQFDECRPQQGTDLGQRMRQALSDLLGGKDIDRAILIGADIPGISTEIIAEAAELLEDNDLVLGPTYDGGYYLIGIKRMCEDLFAKIEWGGAEVLKKTLAAAKRNRLAVAQLGILHDVDELSDLKKFDHLVKFVK